MTAPLTWDVAGGDPRATARRLRRDVRQLQRSRSARSLVEVLSDAYVWAFIALVVGSMLISVVRDLLARTPAAASATDAALVPWLVAAVAVLALAGSAHGLARLGPLVAAPATVSWLLRTPAHRATLLAPSLARLLSLTFVGGAGAAVGLAAAGTSGGAVLPLAALAGLAGVGGLAAAGTAGACVLAQAARRSESAVRVADGTASVAAGAVGALLCWDAFVGSPASPGAAIGLVLTVAGVVSAAAVAGAARALGRLDVGVLSTGAQLVAGVAAAVLSLDSAMLSDLLVERRWRRVGAVPRRRFRGRGWQVLLLAEARRVRRSPALVLAAAAGVLVPYAFVAVTPTLVVSALLAGA